MAPPFKFKSPVKSPWWELEYMNPDIYCQHELQFGKDIIKQGTRLKFKNNRGVYLFRRLVHNSKLDITWIDCVDENTSEIRSFYVENLKMIVKPKRSRRKKPNT